MIEFAFAAALMAQDADANDSIFVLSPLSENCASLDSSQQHSDCYLMPADGRELLISFSFEEGEWSERGRMIVQAALVSTNSDGERQRCPDGCLLQTFYFETESFFYPSLADINDDGFQDIRIPLVTGNVNTEYAIFMGTEDGFLHQPWQVSGFAVESANYDSLIVARSRSSAAESYAEFYRFDGERVIGEATVLLSFMNVENPDDGPDCSLVDGGEYEGEHYYCSLALNR
ncbi:hypothetical protein V0U79_00495 [Hyphobacterium sp. HN65]|uniref:Uncharacterized protein n=1 Tax=Hyphobacterium lacteum TaxID=3116575 RepID=A0ABU7LLM7_9PROT|nr:hypothetical protein [Hyphobacterium sp. HN65]MEE2524830.1 hypothetical protein [Hyphobacterium sp. HN65]